MASDWNLKNIEEFRANEGRVGGYFEGVSLLLLHHKGAKSGTVRVNPLAYQRLDDGSWAIFGSKGGAPTHPDWYFNLQTNPEASIEVGTERHAVKARVAEGAERDRIWAKQKESRPAFAAYEKKTDRVIPVIILEPAD